MSAHASSLPPCASWCVCNASCQPALSLFVALRELRSLGRVLGWCFLWLPPSPLWLSPFGCQVVVSSDNPSRFFACHISSVALLAWRLLLEGLGDARFPPYPRMPLSACNTNWCQVWVHAVFRHAVFAFGSIYRERVFPICCVRVFLWVWCAPRPANYVLKGGFSRRACYQGGLSGLSTAPFLPRCVLFVAIQPICPKGPFPSVPSLWSSG